MTILKTTDLSKSYGRIKAVDSISLQIEKGSVFGILGPNGSGKTTTLSILLDIVKPDRGSYSWFDEIPSHISRKRLGSLLESPNFYEYLSAERNLKIAANIKGVGYTDIDRVLEITNLLDRKKDPFSSYSLGMKQRLALASALLGKPEVLLLDEPTNGLDPQGISEVRKLIQDVAVHGLTVILASHMLDEVEKVCSHVGILKDGRLLAQGRVDEILGDDNLFELKAQDMAALESVMRSFDDTIEVATLKGFLSVKMNKNVSAADVNTYLFSKGITLTHLASRKKNLETQFLEITN